MILYHFTKLVNVERIKREGLWAAPQFKDEEEEGVCFVGGSGLSVIYLCTTPTAVATADELEIFRQRGLPVVTARWAAAGHDEPLARLTLRLPSHDRKLKQYGRWFRAN